MKLSEKTNVSMPIKNMIGIVVAVAMGVFAYTEVTARLTSLETCLLYTSPSPRDGLLSRMPSSA